MIIGIGIDTIDVMRFADWHARADLHRLFSETEISYCRSDITLSAQRFAARFAAREALFKALSSSYNHTIPFLVLCSGVSIEKTSCGAPLLKVDWHLLDSYLAQPISSQSITPHISLSHTATLATAMVILEIVKK